MEIYKPVFCCQECYSDISDIVVYKNLEVEYECPYCGAVKNSSFTSITIGVPNQQYITDSGEFIFVPVQMSEAPSC